MELHWLIETGVFERTARGICEALDAASQSWTRYHDDITSAALPGDDRPVLFWGSLGAAYTERVADKWVPGAVGDVERFACSAYLEGLEGVPFANADAVFSTVAKLAAAPQEVVAPLAGPNRVFVRPDSPLKPFSGRELAVDGISLAALDHGFYYEDDQLAVVVSTPKAVQREWRFVIGDGAVVAGCEYVESREGVGTDVPSEAQAVAEKVAEAAWQAAPLYVMDVGEVNGDYRVMELNPFSGADLYDCDPCAVVETASRIAQQLFDNAKTSG